MLRFEVPWPSKTLSPNARVHWSKRSKAAKAYRADCFMVCFQALRLGKVKAKVPDGALRLDLEFCPPDARRRDDDNCLAAFKSGRDGIAEALGVDDSRFVTQLRMGAVAKGGKVVVTLQAFVPLHAGSGSVSEPAGDTIDVPT